MADGPLQNLATIQVTVDANGSLVLYAKTNSGSNSPAVNAFNTRGRAEASNQLVVTFR